MAAWAILRRTLTPLYRYGAAAWVWRVLIAFGIGAGILLAVLGARLGSWSIALIGVPLLVPALFFGAVVVVRVDPIDPGSLSVRTLLFWRRTLRLGDLGRARLRTRVESDFASLHAPRIWVPVARGLPLYLDLLAEIPDPREFQRVFGVRVPPR